MDRVKSAGCRKCGGFIARQGMVCARCSTRSDGLKTFLLGMIALQGLAVGGFYLWHREPQKSAPEMATVVDDAAPTAGEIAARETHKGWFYYATRDEKLDDTMRHARLASAAEVAQAPPDGTLELRESSIYGRSAVLTIDRKPTDQSADQATLAVKFDDRPPVDFPAQESTDESGIVVAVADYDRFTSAMQGAHAMVVDAQLGTRTERVLHFQVAGLNW